MIRFALLGCGRIGRVHAQNIASHPRASLAAVYDVDAKAAVTVAEQHGAKVASVDDILGDKNIDAVLIATSTPTHADYLVRCVKAGKPVLCEKPIHLDSTVVDNAWREIAGIPHFIMLGFNRRFDPSFKNMRDRVLSGEIGKLEQLVITSRDPAPPPASYVRASGGMFRDMTIHDFDMARYFVGDIVEVYAAGSVLVDPEIGDQGDIDSAMIVMKAASGALVHINNSRRCAYGYDQRLEAFGEKGMLQAHNRYETTIEAWTAASTRAGAPVLDFFQARYIDAYNAEILHFVESLEKGVAPTASFTEGREALRLADAANKAMISGQSVRLDR
jgi:myo-inositol 2-dehydrogenase / D-chiro-inositol 1-dehydrogenase